MPLPVKKFVAKPSAPEAKTWDWPLQHNDGMVSIVNTKERFEADLEIPMFRANEIDVKVMNDELVVHCSQDAGNGRLPREIHRNYHLPKDIDLDTIRTTVRPNGILQITANKRRNLFS